MAQTFKQPFKAATPSTDKPAFDKEAARNRPAIIEDGDDAEIDPSLASAGRIVDEVATITNAQLNRTTFQRKDGTFPTYKDKNGEDQQVAPKVMLKVTFLRENGKTYNEDYEFASGYDFGTSKDGLKLKIQPEAKAAGRRPVVRVGTKGWYFLQSLADAGVKVSMATGLGPLKGLVVQLRERQVKMGQKEYPILLVDTVLDKKSFNAASAGTSVAPALATQEVPEDTASEEERIAGLAEGLLVTLISSAKNSSLERKAIPIAVVKNPDWSSKNPDRPAVIALLGSDEFIKREDAPWNLENGVLTLK